MLRKNIWTYSNNNYDLCRYTGSKFTFYRHPWCDFIVCYTLMYPMSLNFVDYMETHPLRLLLQQKKFAILSLKHKPNGKLWVTKKFKPPRQMTNKWFFQDMFSTKPLLLMRAAACDLFQPDLGPSGGNRLISLTCINIHDFYIAGDWGLATTNGYVPIPTWQNPTQLIVTPKQGSDQTISVDGVTYSKGWFQKQILQAYTVKKSTSQSFNPTYTARYNPSQDTGEGNMVYMCSITSSSYNKPTTDKVLWAQGQPLWLLLFGFQDYVIQLKKPAETMPIYYLMIVSDFIEPRTGPHYPKHHLIIDDSFVRGAGPFNTTTTTGDLNKWYPTLKYQQESMSNIVKTGPFIPKPDPKYANWELHYKSTFYFKWGGSLQGDPQISNPANKKDYPLPDNQQSTIQVTDPQRQISETILHSWDFRRGYITKKALKRMSKHLETESIVSTDSDSQHSCKKPRLTYSHPLLQDQQTEETTCLHSLFEENTSQEEEKEEQTSLKHLIKQQHKQQQGIKLKLLQLLTNMKRAQQQLQLHTGLLE